MSENKFTPRAEEVLRLSQEAAEDLGHGYVGSEHLLLGLIREEEGIAHRVLSEFGVTDEMVCSVLQRSVGKGVSGAAPRAWWSWLCPRRPAWAAAPSAPPIC